MSSAGRLPTAELAALALPPRAAREAPDRTLMISPPGHLPTDSMALLCRSQRAVANPARRRRRSISFETCRNVKIDRIVLHTRVQPSVRACRSARDGECDGRRGNLGTLQLNN